MTTYVFEPSKQGYRCKRCRSNKVSQDRRNLKRRLVQEAGGQCVRCEYNRSFWAMHFHHRDVATKSYDIGMLIRNRDHHLATLEVQKCDLLCANCHAEQEEQKYLGTAV